MATNLSISGKLNVGGGINATSLTASTVLVTDADKNIISSNITDIELGYLSGVTSNIQTQLNSKSGVGKNTEGIVWNIDDTTYTGMQGSEVFNDYQNSISSGLYSHAEGYGAKAITDYSHAEGYVTIASGSGAHAEGGNTIAGGYASHSEGESTTASGYCSHAEGNNNQAFGDGAHVEGYGSSASGNISHAEGQQTISSGISSHAEGQQTKASGYWSHSEGGYTEASGDASHAEGAYTEAIGNYSHTEGVYTKASGNGAHAEGYHTIASSQYQHVQGAYNVEDTEGKYAHIVGCGTSDTDRKNIHTIDNSGNAVFAGKVTVGDSGTIPEPTDDGDLITKKYFSENGVKDYKLLSSTEYPSYVFKYNNNLFEAFVCYNYTVQDITFNDLGNTGLKYVDVQLTFDDIKNLIDVDQLNIISIYNITCRVYTDSESNFIWVAHTAPGPNYIKLRFIVYQESNTEGTQTLNIGGMHIIGMWYDFDM